MTVADNVYSEPIAEVVGVGAKKEAKERVKPAVAAQAEELIYVRSIRAFAMIVIVTLHVAFPLIYLYNSISYADWWVATDFYIWGKIGSPLFTMVSGVLILNPTKDQPIRVFFKKRFVKVLLPFVVWSAIYMFWRLKIRGDVMTTPEIIKLFIEGPVYYHLWFIQMILGLYLATPILRVYIRHANRENLTYFLVVWAVAVSVLPIIQRFVGFNIGIDVVVTTGFAGFFVLGHYLRDVTLKRNQVLPAILIAMGTMIFTQYATHALTVQGGGVFDNFFVLNNSLNLIIVAICLFLFFKTIDYDLLFAKFPFIQKIIMWISSCSLGIYFVHVLIIEELAGGRLGFTLSAASFNPLISIPVLAILVMTLSIITTMILKQIPFVRNIVP